MKKNEDFFAGIGGETNSEIDIMSPITIQLSSLFEK